MNNDVVKKYVYNTDKEDLYTKIEDTEKNSDVSKLDTNSALNTKIKEVKNTIADVSKFLTNSVLNTKVREIENKITNHDVHITTQKFNKLTPEIFGARLKQS